MNSTFYKNLIFNSSIGYAYHEVIFDDKGKPYDYRFLEMNSGFEKFTGLISNDILGKTVREVIPGIVNDEFNWIEYYGNIAMNNLTGEFESYSGGLKSWYKVECFSPEKNFFVTIFSNVTSQKDTEKNLDELGTVFNNVIQDAPIPIMIHRDDGKVISISDSWTEISGYEYKDISTMEKWTKQAYGGKQEVVKNFINDLYDLKHRQHDGEFIINTKNKRQLTWDFYSTYIGKTPSGKKIAMSVAIDVTEERKNKIDLIQERLILETTLLSVGDGVISTDSEGRITLINNVAESLTGWDKEDAIGKNIEEVFSIYNETTGIKSDSIVEKVISTGATQELANHTILVSQSGKEIPIADSAAPIFFEDGKIHGVVLVFRDYTKIYTAQKKLKVSEKRYRELVRNLEAGVIVHAADTSIIMNNEKACELLGLSDDMMKGKTAIDPTWKFVLEFLTQKYHKVNFKAESSQKSSLF